MSLELRRTTSQDPDFRALVVRLDADLRDRYGEIQDAYAPHNILTTTTAIVAARDGVAVGCGCFKPFDDTSVEMKRFFVDPAQRGGGIGRAILQGLETWAHEQGFAAAVLETGDRQLEALRLYEVSGYQRIPNYGPYAELAHSICLRRALP